MVRPHSWYSRAGHSPCKPGVGGSGGCAHMVLDRAQPWGFRHRPVPKRTGGRRGREGAGEEKQGLTVA